MNIYGRGIEDIEGGDDLYFVEEKTEAKQGGFQAKTDFRNKFSWVPVSTHFKSGLKLMSIGTHYGYGITEGGELMTWTTEEDKQSLEKNLNIDLKAVTSDQRDGIIGRTANLLSFGKDKTEAKKLTIIDICANNRGDFCVFSTMEGDNFIFIQRTRTIENLTKLKRVINAMKFIDVQGDEDRTSIKFVCTSANGYFSNVAVDLRFKAREKAAVVHSFDMTVSEINQSKSNSLISKIDVRRS